MTFSLSRWNRLAPEPTTRNPRVQDADTLDDRIRASQGSRQRPARLFALLEVRQSPVSRPALSHAFRERRAGDETSQIAQREAGAWTRGSHAQPGKNRRCWLGAEPAPGIRLRRSLSDGGKGIRYLRRTGPQRHPAVAGGIGGGLAARERRIRQRRSVQTG